jgi:hypothetical protein
MFRTSLAALGLYAGLAGSAMAADANQRFFIMGEPGTMTCETLNTKLNDEAAGVALGTWLAGYITALNRTTPDTYNLIGGVQPTDIFNAIIAHCASTPADYVEGAAYAAIEAVYDRRQTSAP